MYVKFTTAPTVADESGRSSQVLLTKSPGKFSIKKVLAATEFIVVYGRKRVPCRYKFVHEHFYAKSRFFFFFFVRKGQRSSPCILNTAFER